MTEIIKGGVCAPKGYTAAGVHCGVRRNRSKRDLALIYSEKTASAAAVPTACPSAAQVPITRVELMAAWVTEMFRPANRKSDEC